MRILFVTHTGAWSGAEANLGRLIGSLGADHETAVACSPRGRFAAEMDRIAVPRFTIPAAEASFRLDPIQTPRGAATLAIAGAALRRAARRFQPDVIHAGTVRAGLIAAVAGVVRGSPLVVSVHDNLPRGRLGHAVRRVIAHSADQVIAVSRFTAGRFNEGLATPVADCVYNGIDHDRFDPLVVAPAALRAELQLADGAALLGVVGQITPWKGQDTAIRALAQLRARGLDAHLLIVGRVVFAGSQVRFDNHAFLRALHRLTADLGLADSVHFLGQRGDVPGVLRALDLLLVPSWDEPLASVVMESAAMGTPAVVSSVGGAPELLVHGVSGMVVAPTDPGPWADAVARLLGDEPARDRMGEHARRSAARFKDETHAREMVAAYDRALSARGVSSRRRGGADGRP